MTTRNLSLLDLKVEIKKWENDFLEKNNRKPCKNDIENAQDSIKILYQNYFKMKKEVNKKLDCQDSKKFNVWDSSFNKSQNSAPKKVINPSSSNNKNHYNLISSKLKGQFLEEYSGKLKKNNSEKRQDSVCTSSSSSSNLDRLETNDSDLNLGGPINNYKVNRKVSGHERELTALESDIFPQTYKIIPKSKCKNVNADWLSRCNPQKEIAPVDHVSVNQMDFQPKLSPKNQTLKRNHFASYEKETADSRLSQCSIEVSSIDHKQSYENSPSTIQKSTEKRTKVTEESCTEMFVEDIVNSEPKIKISEPFSKKIPCEDNQNDISELKSEHELISKVNCPRSDCDEENSTQTKSTSEPVKRRKVVHKSPDEKVSGLSSKKVSSLERKMKCGTQNENFVRINLRKKRFSRGHHAFSSKAYKFQKWKEMKFNKAESHSISTCFKCGEIGHWAKFCTKEQVNQLMPSLANEPVQDDSPFPTLSEAAAMVQGIKSSIATTKLVINSDDINSSFQETVPDLDKTNDAVKSFKGTKPLCPLQTDGSIQDEDVDQANSQLIKTMKDAAIKADSTCSQSWNKFFATTLELMKHRRDDISSFQETASNLDITNNAVESFKGIKPQFPLQTDGSIQETPNFVFEALKEFGYSEFRAGQETTVMRILSGLSTLVVQSTGSGKSLCYQLPAYIYAQKTKCITLVISPLVSLMEDQVKGLPVCLKAACFHTNQTSVQRKKVLESVQDGKVHVLLVSPEAIVGGNGSSGFLPSKIPPVAFACIDEVHCVSEWSHNFRPSYLRICKVLFDRFGVKCFLGLTATATIKTIKSIALHLNISNFNSAVIKGAVVPDNLILSASRDYNRDKALIKLLEGERFSNCDSIIVYCTRRQLTEQLATVIRTTFQDVSKMSSTVKKRGRALSLEAEAYHAGLSAARRKSVQNQFMSGKLRIVVATVAFGMGIDKSDVRAVIHYNMPKSFESYVQEIGRAGRDGLLAHCHVFLDSEGNDTNELKRHVYANSVDRHTIRKLVQRIFPKECNCPNSIQCEKHEVAVPLSPIVQDLDLKEESISTLLCYLELHPKRWINVLNPVYATCQLKIYSSSINMKSLAKRSPPVAAAIAIQIEDKTFQENINSFEFSVVEVSSKMGWNSGAVKKELKSLEWNTKAFKSGSAAQKSGVLVEFSDLAFHVNAVGNLCDDELDEILDFLYNCMLMQEKCELYQLNEIYNALFSINFNTISFSISHANYWACCDNANSTKSQKLKQALTEYFMQESANLKGGILDKLAYGQNMKVKESDQTNEMSENRVSRVKDLELDMVSEDGEWSSGDDDEFS
ncbi:ATP-dependent DNA helicase Q4 [Nymphon striatum]|nr:ATP-dependent DNA helicase Q4 [Nymphon striatum]